MWGARGESSDWVLARCVALQGLQGLQGCGGGKSQGSQDFFFLEFEDGEKNIPDRRAPDFPPSTTLQALQALQEPSEWYIYPCVVLEYNPPRAQSTAY